MKISVFIFALILAWMPFSISYGEGYDAEVYALFSDTPFPPWPQVGVTDTIEYAFNIHANASSKEGAYWLWIGMVYSGESFTCAVRNRLSPAFKIGSVYLRV